MKAPKKIGTDRYYGKDTLILWIYNQAISDEFPALFSGFWDIYEAWYDHEDRINEGLSSFLFDTSLPQAEQHWKRERFGNYLYGSLTSIYFSWESLRSLKAVPRSRDIQHDISRIHHINGVVRYLFTALDALACCIYIAEDQIRSGRTQAQAEPSDLRGLTIKSIKKTTKKVGAYGSLQPLLNSSEFKYLSEYRNLLTHRPFPQFMVDPKGARYLPESLLQLDSMTRQNYQYQKLEVGDFLAMALGRLVPDFESLLPELAKRYRSHVCHG